MEWEKRYCPHKQEKNGSDLFSGCHRRKKNWSMPLNVSDSGDSRVRTWPGPWS